MVWLSMWIACTCRSDVPTEASAGPRLEDFGKRGQRTQGLKGDVVKVARPSRVIGKVHFLDTAKLEAGDANPFTVVEREMNAGDIERNVLHYLFRGPTAEEQSRGLRFVSSGAVGYTNVRAHDGGVTVQLRGECKNEGGVYTVADHIERSLEELGHVTWVQLLGPDGATANPGKRADSRPDCLEP